MKPIRIGGPGVCTESTWKTDLYRVISRALSKTGLSTLSLSVSFAGSRLHFLLPTAYAERALDNLEHVLVDCDYYKLGEALPRPGHRVLDVGGFLGFYAAASSTLVSPSGSIYVVEPGKHVIPFLYANIHRNKRSEVRIYPVAVCPESGFRKLYVGRYPAVSSFFIEHVEKYTDVAGVLEVKCLKLSTLIRYLGFLHTVKLDVEGLEAGILRESTSELSKVNTLVVEVHTDVADLAEVEKAVSYAGFNRILLYTSSEMPHQNILYAIK